MKSLHLSILYFLVFILCSCEKEKSSTADSIVYQEQGIFVVNEGAYQANNGSVSYLQQTGRGVISDLFKNVNNVPLGDVVQSMNIYNGRGYMVVNNSKKVEVVSMVDFSSIGTITGFLGPRYFLPVNADKAYVSDWFSNQIKVIDLISRTISSTIDVGAGPEQMALSNGKVYVANVGGYGNDSIISVIDVATNSVIKTIEVGLNPNSIVNLQNGGLLVLCGGTTGADYIGGTADDVAGQLILIDPLSDNISQTLNFSQSFHPLKLVTKKTADKIYFLGGDNGYTGAVYDFDLNLFIHSLLIPGSYYGLGVNPADGNIFCGQPGFSAREYFLKFKADGSLIDSSLVGIGPNGFVFN